MAKSYGSKPFGDDWLAVLKRVADKQHAMEQGGGIVWFWGHADVSWTLNPTLHRYIVELESQVGITVSSTKPTAEEHNAHKFVTEASGLSWNRTGGVCGVLFSRCSITGGHI